MEQAERLMNQHYQFKSQFMKNLEKDILNSTEEDEIDVEVISCPSYSAFEDEEDVPDSDEEKYWNRMYEEEEEKKEKKKEYSYSFYQTDKKNKYKMCPCCIDSCKAGGCPVQRMLNKDFKPEEDEEKKMDTFPYYDDDNFIIDSKEQKPNSDELVVGLTNDIPLALIFELCENLEKVYPIDSTDVPFERIDFCGSKTNNHLIVSEAMSLILHQEDFENHFIKLVLNDTLPNVYSYTFKYINCDEYYRTMDNIILRTTTEEELYQKQFLNCLLQMWLMRNHITFFEHQSLKGIRDIHLSYDSMKAYEYVGQYGYSYKMIVILTHLMNHYYTKNIYPSMNSLLLRIYYIHDELNKFNSFDL